MDLERCEGFILDNVNLAIIHTDSMSSIRFDFNNMYCYEDNKKSQRKPIRYDADSDKILKWTSQQWRSYGVETNTAAVRLFNNFHERQILGD